VAEGFTEFDDLRGGTEGLPRAPVEGGAIGLDDELRSLVVEQMAVGTTLLDEATHPDTAIAESSRLSPDGK